MDNKKQTTDQFFRERLSVYEEMPGDQVWGKIASRLESQKRKKLVFLFLRIAAGMTLLLSLGLGYHFMNLADKQNAEAVITKPSTAEKAIIAPSSVNKAPSSDIDQLSISSEKINKSNTAHPRIKDKLPYAYTPVHTDPEAQTLSGLNMRESSLLPVFAPYKLGFRRLSQEEILEQTAALTSGDDEEYTIDDVKDDRWMLGSEIAPLYSYRKIESDYLSSSAVQDMNNSEQGLMAYAGGFRVGYTAGRRLSVQSGLYYSRYGQEKNNGEALLMDQFAYVDEANVTYLSIPNSTGTIQANEDNTSRYEKIINSSNGNKEDFYTNSGFPAINTDRIPVTEGNITAIQYFDYLELPVTVKYKIIDRKLSFSVLGGVITNFLVNNGVKLKQDGNVETFGTTSDISKVNYQGSVGLGFDYPLMDRLAISVEPRFRYYLNPIFDQKFNVHPYSFGIFAGISYTLK